MCFGWLLSSKAYFKVCFEAQKVKVAIYSCQSPLINTSILNDIAKICSISRLLRHVLLKHIEYTFCFHMIHRELGIATVSYGY